MCAKVTAKRTDDVEKSKKKLQKVQKINEPKNETPNKISQDGKKNKISKKPSSKDRPLWVIKIRCLPFGFFEDQLSDYFKQFGTVVRVRVARNLKTGNSKGRAYVGFDDKDVAEIAAETMNGYLMFNHRLIVTVMKPGAIPKSMLGGPMLVPRPSMRASAQKDAKRRNNVAGKEKAPEKEAAAKQRRSKKLEKNLKSLAEMGIEYELPQAAAASASSPPVEEAPKTPKKRAAEKEVGGTVAKKAATSVPASVHRMTTRSSKAATSVEVPVESVVSRAAKNVEKKADDLQPTVVPKTDVNQPKKAKKTKK